MKVGTVDAQYLQLPGGGGGGGGGIVRDIERFLA